MPNSSSRIRKTSSPVENAAKRLRKNSTPAEQALWQVLKGGKLAGLKFRRQHPVGNFILDFYCPAHKLVIEVDGAIHQTQVEYDSARTIQLETYGYTVLRFQNEMVLHQIETVLAKILQTVLTRNIVISPSPPAPLPIPGEGSKKRELISLNSIDI
jgi:very-short-patch-repair endonuclease